MAKFKGDKASFTFGGTVYECLTNWSYSGTASQNRIRCSGSSGAVEHDVDSGTEDTFTADHLLEGASATVAAALLRNTTGTFEAHAEGDSTGVAELTATSARVTSMSITNTPDSLTILSVTFGLTGTVAIGAAT